MKKNAGRLSQTLSGGRILGGSSLRNFLIAALALVVAAVIAVVAKLQSHETRIDSSITKVADPEAPIADFTNGKTNDW